MNPFDVALNHQQISLHSPFLIAAYFREQGLSIEPLLRDTQLSIADLETPNRLITMEQEQKVFANAVNVSGNPLLSLDVGRQMRVSAYGQLGYAMLSAPTFGDALQVMIEFQALLGCYFRLSLESLGADFCAIRADRYKASSALRLFNIQLCLSSIKAMMDDVSGRPMNISAVHISTQKPGHAGSYERYFGQSELLVGQDAERLVFPAAQLKSRLPLADSITFFEASRQCLAEQEALVVPSSALLEQIRSRLEQQLQSPPGFEQLAEQMHSTTRTLRRHLTKAGSGYQQLLDQLRFQRAKELLEEPHVPIYEIAEQLGFSETASFRHAFVRWAGVSPSVWRQRLR